MCQNQTVMCICMCVCVYCEICGACCWRSNSLEVVMSVGRFERTATLTISSQVAATATVSQPSLIKVSAQCPKCKYKCKCGEELCLPFSRFQNQALKRRESSNFRHNPRGLLGQWLHSMRRFTKTLRADNEQYKSWEQPRTDNDTPNVATLLFFRAPDETRQCSQ